MAQKKLDDIWKQAPPDYYDEGMRSNLFQFIWHTNKIRVFKKIVKKEWNFQILDVGCASGFMTNKIASLFPDSRVTGIDVYKDAISLAKQKYHSISFIVGDAHKISFPDNTFNLTVCYETIEHVLEPEKVLREMHRVTKKDGTAVVAMDSGNLLFRLIWWFWEKSKGRVWQGAHLHPFHHTELEKAIKKSGFKIKKKYFSHLGMEVLFVLGK